jgi:hypothetical protein
MENTKLFRIDEQNHHLQQNQELNNGKKSNINNTNLEIIRENFYSNIDENSNLCNKKYSLINETEINSDIKIKKNVMFNDNNIIFNNRSNNTNNNNLNIIINIFYFIIILSLLVKTIYNKDSINLIYVLLYTFIYILIKIII